MTRRAIRYRNFPKRVDKRTHTVHNRDMTTTQNIATEIFPKLLADPAVIAASTGTPEEFAAALESELPRILEAHRIAMARAFDVLADVVVTRPTDTMRYFGPRILEALAA